MEKNWASLRHDALLESLEEIRGVTEKPGKAVIKTGDCLWLGIDVIYICYILGGIHATTLCMQGNLLVLTSFGAGKMLYMLLQNYAIPPTAPNSGRLAQC